MEAEAGDVRFDIALALTCQRMKKNLVEDVCPTLRHIAFYCFHLERDFVSAVVAEAVHGRRD